MDLQYLSLFLTCVLCCSVAAQRNGTRNRCSGTDRLSKATHIRAFRDSTSSLRIAWSPPSNSICFADGLQYKVLYEVYEKKIKHDNLKQEKNETTATLGGTQNITIHGLRNNTIYKVTFTIISQAGLSSRSSTKKCTLQSGPALDELVGICELKCFSQSNAIHLSWQQPSTDTGIRYNITKRLINENQCQRISNSPEANVFRVEGWYDGTSWRVVRLLTFSTYRLKLTAGKGGKPYVKKTIDCRTEETRPSLAPKKITVLKVTNSSLKFTWENIPCQSTRGKFKEYFVSFDGETYRCKENQTIFRNLTCGETYKFQVGVATGKGYGPISEPLIVTLTQPPHGVRNVNVSALYPSSLFVEWEQPFYTGCPEQYLTYNVTCKVIERSVCKSILLDDRNANSGSLESISNTNVIIPNLHPLSTYAVQVVAQHTLAGPGSLVVKNATTLGYAPGPVRNIKFDLASNTLTWQQPENFGCPPLNQYIIEEQLIKEGVSETPLGDSVRLPSQLKNELTVDKLKPFSEYRFFITAAYGEIKGDEVKIDVKTPEAEPTPPSGLDTTANNTSLTVTWSVPDHPHGIIKKYYIMYWETAENESRSTNVTRDVNGGTTQYCMFELRSLTNYSIQVRAQTGGGKGKWSEIITAVTKEGIPSEPIITSCSSTQTSITLKWEPPLKPNGHIQAYEVHYRPIAKPYDPLFKSTSSNHKFVHEQYPASIQEAILTVLPSTKYEILISATTSAGGGDSARIKMFTLPAANIDQPQQAQLMSFTKTSLTIKIPTVESQYVVSYQIGVRKEYTKPKRFSDKPSTYEVNPYDYIAAEIHKVMASEPFEVGDNKTYGIYYNAPLIEGVTYKIRVRAVSRANESSYTKWGELLTFTSVGSQQSQQATGAVAGISVVIVLLIGLSAILVVVMVYKRRRERLKADDGHKGIESMELVQKKNVNKGESLNCEGSSKRVKVLPSASKLKANKKPNTAQKQDKFAAVKPIPQVENDYKPVPLDQLSEYIQAHRAGYRYDDNNEEEQGASGFTKEFNSIPFSQTHPCNISRHPDNVKKNRYLDIAAYDHSRVKLQLLDGIPRSDYINASLVKGYKEKVYIACQGPNSMTVNDMWRMIWEQNSAKVVMLTNLIEKGKKKCEQYWPAELNEYRHYGLLLVQMTSEECLANYTIRTFEVKTLDEDLPAREFKQFHYTTWPDMGVPQSATPLLNFMKVAGAYTFEGAGPDIVHCSAGVGRTGTYIGIEAMLSMAAEEGQIDVHAMVYQLRKDRVKMVQTEAQYEFIFDAVLESIFCGDTSIMVTNLRAEYVLLLAKDKTTGKTKLEKQFETLESLTEFPPPNAYKGGKLEENADKNRFPDKIPPDRVRPYLMTPGTEGSTNYINAAYLDGYRGKAMYLATQMPLPNTINDIWRMVYDYKSSTIVMLNDMDTDDPTIGQYWPESRSQDYGQIEVTLESMTKFDDIIARTFAVKCGDTSDSVTVQQLQFTGWPAGNDVPNNVTSLLSLVNLLMQHHKGGPITVHCMDGVGRSGTFCTLLSVLERMQEEKLVDVFQAVRRLRRGIPGVVKTLGQYKLLFEAAQANLEEYSIYENFNA